MIHPGEGDTIQVKGLSASTITRLKEVCQGEFQEWSRRPLKGKEYVYGWADGVHFNIRLEEDRQCILVLMGPQPMRHRRTKGNGSRLACLTMVFKLMQSASKKWRLLNGSQLLPDVIAGVQFIDGLKPQTAAA